MLLLKYQQQWVIGTAQLSTLRILNIGVDRRHQDSTNFHLEENTGADRRHCSRQQLVVHCVIHHFLDCVIDSIVTDYVFGREDTAFSVRCVRQSLHETLHQTVGQSDGQTAGYSLQLPPCETEPL